MTSMFSMFTFGIGAFFIGVAFTIKTIFFLFGQHSQDKNEGCLGNLFAIVALAIAFYFFHIFLVSM